MQETQEEIVARVKERADIVQIIGEHIDLRKSGARFIGLCPFHGEKTPSFSVHPGQQFFYCFGCGESGDVLSFMMKYDNLDFPSALKTLAGKYGITLPEKKRSPEQEKRERQRKLMFELNDRAADVYRKKLLGSKMAQRYLEERGIPEAIGERFGLGYAPSTESGVWDFLSSRFSESELVAAQELGLSVKKERGGCYDRFRDRILFPIYELSGRVCGFGGRIIGEGNPKYLNSPESSVYNKSKLLLGLYQQKEAIRKRGLALVVEGNFDLISLVCHGVENVVAPLGTAVTREQLRLLKRFADDVVLLFDGDTAGVKAAVRAVPLFLAEQVSGRVALLPHGHDPDTFVREFGAEAVEELVEKAETLPEFVFSYFVDQYGLTLDGKGRIVEELRPLVKSASSSLQRSVIIAHFADQLGLEVGKLEEMFAGKSQPPGPPAPQMPEQMVEQMAEQMVEPGVAPRREEAAPLTAAQQRLVNFMVMNPSFFSRLDEGGLRHCLVGSVGEVVYLQMRMLIGERDDVEPEELLSALSEGVEKKLVSDMLLAAAPVKEDNAELDRAELEELLDWMRCRQLEQSSREVLRRIGELQSGGDHEELVRLLTEKQRIDRQLQGLDS